MVYETCKRTSLMTFELMQFCVALRQFWMSQSILYAQIFIEENIRLHFIFKTKKWYLVSYISKPHKDQWFCWVISNISLQYWRQVSGQVATLILKSLGSSKIWRFFWPVGMPLTISYSGNLRVFMKDLKTSSAGRNTLVY